MKMLVMDAVCVVYGWREVEKRELDRLS